MKESQEKKSIFAEWLEQLQQESWQLELLISGLALFGIWEAEPIISSLDNYLDEYVYGGVMGDMAPAFLFIIKVGWRIFFINLLIHVVLRGLWIGSIGLRYISGEIDYEQLNYSELFTERLKKKVGKYDDFIERLEWICSVLFAYTFLLFLLFLSMTMFFTVIPITMEIIEMILGEDNVNEGISGLIIMVYVIIGFIVFIDFMTLGSFKKINDKTVSKIYYFIYSFYSFVTLSFLYRPLLYNFLDDKYTRRLFFFSVPYILILAFGNKMFTNNVRPHFDDNWRMVEQGQMIKTCNYGDLKNQALENSKEENKSDRLYCTPSVILSQYYLDHPYPNLFFRMKMSDQKLLDEKLNLSPIFHDGLRFSMFRSSRKSDDDLEIILESKDESLREVREEIRKLRKIKDDESRAKIEELKLIRDKGIDEKESMKKDYESEKRNKILAGMQGFNDVKIDGVSYNDSLNCNFYIHPDNGVKGILCHFPSRSLSQGYHELHIKRTEWNKREPDSLGYLTFRLPFIKLN